MLREHFLWPRGRTVEFSLNVLWSRQHPSQSQRGLQAQADSTQEQGEARAGAPPARAGAPPTHQGAGTAAHALASPSPAKLGTEWTEAPAAEPLFTEPPGRPWTGPQPT